MSKTIIDGYTFEHFIRPSLGNLLKMRGGDIEAGIPEEMKLPDGYAIQGQGPEKNALIMAHWPMQRSATDVEQIAIEKAWKWVKPLR